MAVLRKLLADRGRFVYFHDLGLISTIKRDFRHKEIKVLPASFRKYYHYVAFSKKVSPEIIEKISSAISNLSKNGALNRIRAQYASFE